ncbi:hypothetical protein OD91_0554 [Lutibacter sp. Hel_I_33_5]|uniref:hypothetical protein n=1 Tax=Lutibacter sp. Hel_I_33_5 TaxID=1566289 RepID=UPI00119DAB36|nr:hypothetical protein [Lutibacter sp. Hel_I_33_5]TVZ55308.1 hypothetical protein OD91_0554 [Lutibacter sp. Hel_I_33_5]
MKTEKITKSWSKLNDRQKNEASGYYISEFQKFYTETLTLENARLILDNDKPYVKVYTPENIEHVFKLSETYMNEVLLALIKKRDN